jgi:SAM-dependent methyltransferase
MPTDTGVQSPEMATSNHDDARGDACFEIELRCPRCSANLSGFLCSKCGFHMCENRGVVHALPPERATHFAQFIADYEHVRAAEGRGSANDEFYLGLPYRDLSGRNSEQWRIRACNYECLVARVLKPALLSGARILDLGAGNCWLSFRLALAGFRPCAVDLLTNEFDGLRAAEHFRAHLPQAFPRFQAELTHLPFQDGQFDAVVFNASFHYAESARAALKEALRCVKSGGIVIISDTPWYSCEESGRIMISERRGAFLRRYGTDSASIESIEYLTTEHLQHLAESLSISWTTHSPRYGFKWAMRPFLAKVRGRREPARFRIYVARKVHEK